MPPQPHNPVIQSRLARWLACGLMAIGMRDLVANDSPLGQGSIFRPVAQAVPVSAGGGPVLRTNAAPAPVESDLPLPLRQALGPLASTNVHPPPPDPRKINPAHEFKMLLDLARRQRAEKTYTPAKRTLQ